MLIKRLITLLMLFGTAFLLTAKTPDPKALVAKVGDRSYDYKTFNDGFKAYLEYHVKGAALSSQDSVRYNNQYWEELVGIWVYDKAIKAGKIKVTNAELEADIKKNIPGGIKQIKDFYTKDKFDNKKYEKALAENPEFKKSVIEYTRDMYSYKKLINSIKGEVTANPDSVKAKWTIQNNRADATIIHFDYSKLKSITVSDEEARQYYQEHLQDYRRENGRGYTFVRFQGAFSKADDSEARAKDNKNKSAALFTRAKEIGLVQAAAELKIPLEESSMFSSSDEIIPRIGRAPSLITFAFNNPAGTMPDVFYAPTGDILVLELNRELPEYYQEFELKKPEIQITATRTKRMYTMDQYVQNFLRNETPDTYLAAARRDSLDVIELTDITEDAMLKQIGNISKLNKAILNTDEGSFTQLIEKDKHWYLAKVTKRYLPDFTIWEKDKKSIIDTANSEAQQEHLNQWYLNERSKVELIDNRHEYYPIRQLIKM
ncbi:MAG: peptidylprolyl isomerase [Candidatus Cloacimonetes bacterium]|nr:peptidylprolyl isomerase [Candidatus Cloacimonadota bacterium]